MSSNTNKMAAARKVRSEYMKKYRNPKWDACSKNYEDSVKYRVNRRVMEQTHNPLFWDGWDSGSESLSSGRSSPKFKDVLEAAVANKLHIVSDSRGDETDDTQDTVVTVVNGKPPPLPPPPEAHSTMGDTSAVGKAPYNVIHQWFSNCGH